MNVCVRLLAVDEGGNMRMMEAFQNRDFGGQVVLQFLVQLRHVHRLDGNKSFNTSGILELSVKNYITGLKELTYSMGSFVDGSKTATANFFLFSEAAPNLFRLFGPSRGLGMWIGGGHDCSVDATAPGCASD